MELKYVPKRILNTYTFWFANDFSSFLRFFVNNSSFSEPGIGLFSCFFSKAMQTSLAQFSTALILNL